MAKIQTRLFNYGNEKESAWPPQFPDEGNAGRHFFYDKEQKKVVEGYPLPEGVNSSAFVQQDTMEPTQHMKDGKWYTSKREFRKTTRRYGCEEIGDQIDWRNKPTKDPKQEQKLEEAVGRAYYQVRDGMAPLSEFDKERCKIINRNIREHNYDRREYDRDGKLRD